MNDLIYLCPEGSFCTGNNSAPITCPGFLMSKVGAQSPQDCKRCPASYLWLEYCRPAAFVVPIFAVPAFLLVCVAAIATLHVRIRVKFSTKK